MPATYRMDAYRAPVPATVPGARTIGTATAHDLWLHHAASFVDVLPRAPHPAGLPAGTIWHRAPHRDIPGSLWLPDTGYGALPPPMQAYFASGLTRESGGDRGRKLVIYCRADCWMSWNAAKRAAAMGYRAIDWYPLGVDGWRRAGLPLAIARPAPRPVVTEAASGSPAPAHTAAAR
ncbi:MAG TPA: PQQ-dependent catabolism-associated CXXCW motif protein [Acetobacteraceae bacterium]|nr:PQQ-dependent catabolism-associated CXXCW motif protein [Acetobacteraceae bacterium]